MTTQTGPAPGQGEQPSAGAYLRLVGLAVLIGAPAGLLAAGFLALVNQVQNLLRTDLPNELGYSSPPWYLVVGLPWWAPRWWRPRGRCSRATAVMSRSRA